RAPMKVIHLLFTIFVLALLSVACGPRTSEMPDPEAETVVFDVELVVTRDGETTTMAPATLFKEASAQLQREEWENCARDFDILWRSLEGSDYYSASLYNAGLCWERQAVWDEAAERYLILIDDEGTTRDGLDAYFRLAEVDANDRRWDRVRAAMLQVLEREDLKHFDRLEARYRLGMAHIALQEI